MPAALVYVTNNEGVGRLELRDTINTPATIERLEQVGLRPNLAKMLKKYSKMGDMSPDDRKRVLDDFSNIKPMQRTSYHTNEKWKKDTLASQVIEEESIGILVSDSEENKTRSANVTSNKVKSPLQLSFDKEKDEIVESLG